MLEMYNIYPIVILFIISISIDEFLKQLPRQMNYVGAALFNFMPNVISPPIPKNQQRPR
jgi:hypothetical protein